MVRRPFKKSVKNSKALYNNLVYNYNLILHHLLSVSQFQRIFITFKNTLFSKSCSHTNAYIKPFLSNFNLSAPFKFLHLSLENSMPSSCKIQPNWTFACSFIIMALCLMNDIFEPVFLKEITLIITAIFNGRSHAK